MGPMGVREQEVRGLSARHMILLFLAGVAVCGVFFSLGFLVGYNERLSGSAPVTERVSTPGIVPPTVNPPAESASAPHQVAVAGQAPANPAPVTDARLAASPGGNPPESSAKTPAAPATPPPAAPAATTKPGTNPQKTPVAAPDAVGQGITLQVAALRTKQDAEALVNILKGRSYPVFLVTPEYAHADDNLFRVQVGPFKTREEAEKVRAKLSQEGFKPFIRH